MYLRLQNSWPGTVCVMVAHLWNSRKESRFHVAVMFMLRSAQLAPAALVAMAME